MDAYAKEYSKAFDSSFSLWKSNYIGMAKKTVIKQALKYAPIKADFQKALSTDEMCIRDSYNSDNKSDRQNPTYGFCLIYCHGRRAIPMGKIILAILGVVIVAVEEIFKEDD